MILTISGRCDIPALYSEWLFNRIKAGFVDVRNPFYPKQVSRLSMHPDAIDALVFCTKNPIPMLSRLDELDAYNYLFQVTLTSYGKDIEPALPSKKKIIEAIKQLSNRIGKQRVVVRFDPILISKTYTVDYHVMMFERLCKQLSPYVNRVVISFVDLKKNTMRNSNTLQLIPFNDEMITELAQGLGALAKQYGMTIQTCAEPYDLSTYGITKEGCLSASMVYELTGNVKGLKKNRNRENCNCVATVDIGTYNCCSLFCKYCYANYDEGQVVVQRKLHNPNSSLLIGELKEDDIIKERSK